MIGKQEPVTGSRKTVALDDTSLGSSSGCGFSAPKYRFPIVIYLVFPALVTFFNDRCRKLRPVKPPRVGADDS